ncbi:MAG: guanylate kinase [Gammaproteobacteria bacterium]|nr:guanylate kinase [Gammaproteobacteria bacterium]
MTAKDIGRLYVVAAPSGAGKTSLLRAILEQVPNTVVSISYTTRTKREKEQEGVDYRFVTDSEFQKMVGAGEFLEHARVFDHSYGTARKDVASLRQNKLNVVLEIDWQGASQVREIMPDSESIFILPPTRQALESRLRERSTDSDEVIKRRLADSVADMSHWDEFDYIVVNDEFDTAVDELREIVSGNGGRYRKNRARLKDLVSDLLGE